MMLFFFIIFFLYGVPAIILYFAIKKAKYLSELGLPEECGDCNKLSCKDCPHKNKGGDSEGGK